MKKEAIRERPIDENTLDNGVVANAGSNSSEQNNPPKDPEYSRDE